MTRPFTTRMLGPAVVEMLNDLWEAFETSGVATNLSYTASPTDGVVASDTGTDATISLADGTNAGLMAPAQHTQLAGLTAALADKADLASPALTGTPTAPTAAAATNTTQIATTAFVRSEVAALIASSPAALDTLDELANALGDDPNFAATMATAIGLKEASANKDASGGYAGLTLFKLNLRNAANTITSWFTTAATAARTWTMPDKDGTVAMTSDITAAAVGLSNVDDTSDATKNAAAVTLTNKTITTPTISGAVLNDGITEEVYPVVDAAGVAISPTNGSLQTWTLGASRTPTLGTWAAGASLTLHIADGAAYTVTWTTMGVVWVGGTAPTLPTTGYGIVELWKIGSTIYGASCGNVA